MKSVGHEERALAMVYLPFMFSTPFSLVRVVPAIVRTADARHTHISECECGTGCCSCCELLP